MTVILIGANYRNLPLADLEKLESAADQIRTGLFNDKSDQHGIDGAVVVSTCNRFEIYLDTDDVSRATNHARQAIKEAVGFSDEFIQANLIQMTDAAAIDHLFRVTAGLESMVVGEAEIAGQIKRSLTDTHELGHTSRITEALFQRAALVSKKVTTETGLGAAGRSLITVALGLVKQRHFNLKEKKVLVIGTGAYARVVIAALNREAVGEIFVYSTSGRAELFSQNHPTTPISSDQLLHTLRNIDLLVACSGTLGTTLQFVHLTDIPQEILPVIDLALSPDVDKSVRSLPGVTVIDLEEIHRHAPVEHLATIKSAEAIIKAAVREFQQDLAARANDPLVRALRSHVNEIVDQEVERVRLKSGNEIAQQVERSLQLVTKTIFHRPTVHARSTAIAGEHDQYQKAIELLFGLEVEADDGN